MSRDEKAIIKDAQEGNILAFETLVYKYDRQVLRLIQNLVSNTQDAQDIYQEVFVRVFKNLRRFQFRSQFSTWLYRVVVNYCINFNKRKARTRYYSLEDGQNEGEPGWFITVEGKELNPENAALNKELSQEIETALNQLSTQQKTVFVLRHYHGHKLKDIAEMMNCTEGTIKNYLFRATQKMQQLLRSYARS
ncbi:sigma-70 family RNA polymerase sigma factor [bacterium]|nr:sigma-70 family RNA polymerase sigma factor [bacterium]